jgi:hypothetical protein
MGNYQGFADIKKVKQFLFAAALSLLCTSCFAYRILYAEQFYELYHLHFYQYPDDTMENIGYLEQALKADFANPLYALAKIKDPKEWERYRYLFKMHVNLRLVQLYLTLASGYDKRIAYFFNAPWKEENLKTLEQAESIYRYALLYWDEAKKWSLQAKKLRYHLKEIQNWEDESFRIETGELDYRRIIGKQLDRVAKVRKQFESMDQSTY